MTRLIKHFLLGSSLAAAAIVASAQSPQTPLALALNAPAQGPQYAYDIRYETEDVKASAKVDPSQIYGQRVTLHSPGPDKRPMALRAEIDDLEQDPEGVLWCHTFNSNIAESEALLISETDQTATYHFSPVPDPDDKDEAKLMKHLIGAVTVDKKTPGILHFSLRSIEPFKPMFLAKVKAFDLKARCEHSPDGRTYLAELEVIVSGKAMGRKFYDREYQAIKTLMPVPSAPKDRR